MNPRVVIPVAVAMLLTACGGERAYHQDERFTPDSRHRRGRCGRRCPGSLTPQPQARRFES
jgi:hypothetical protein